MVPLKSGKWFAWSSSLLLLASGIASFWFWTSNHPHIETDDYQSLNVSSLKELWEWRREVLPYWFAIGALNTMGFLLLIPTSICLKKMFKGECPGMKTWSMKCAFVLGAVLAAISFLEMFGFQLVSNRISSWSKLPDSAFPELELNSLQTIGGSAWKYVLQYVFLSLALFLVARLTLRDMKRRLPIGHAVLGVLTGTLGLITTLIGILCIFDYSKFIMVYGVMSWIWGSVLFPLWLAILGFYFHNSNGWSYKPIYEESVNHGVIAASSVSTS